MNPENAVASLAAFARSTPMIAVSKCVISGIVEMITIKTKTGKFGAIKTSRKKGRTKPNTPLSA